MDPTTRRIEELAHEQMGRFTRAQVAQHAANGRVLVQSRLRSGKWRRETSRVLSLPGAPRSREARIWTAWLHCGDDAVVSHFSAARLHGLPVPDEEPDSLTVPWGCNRSVEGCRVHQRAPMESRDVQRMGRLPMTTIDRTLYDLGAMAARARLEAWLDGLTAERRVDPGLVAATVERLSVPGRRSVPVLVEVLAERLPGLGVEQGPLELALRQVVVLAGLPEGRVQHPHPGIGDRREYVDRAWPEARLVVEADGRCWHDRIEAASRDASRDRSAAAEGWLTVRFRHEDLVGDPAGSVAQLRRIYRDRVATLAGDRPGPTGWAGRAGRAG